MSPHRNGHRVSDSKRVITGTRADDPAKQSVRFRVALIAHKYPVQLALLIAVMVLVYPVYLVLENQGDLRQADRSLRTATAEAREQAAIARDLTDRLRAATEANCKRIHGVVGTLEAIIIDGREQLKRYERDGTITRKQLGLALADNEKARIKLVGADCPPRKR